MCDQTEIDYSDGDVVWVKLGSWWWPGEVVGPEKLPPDVLPSFRKPPIAVVKFFQEDTYEYVRNINSIYKYNCSRKTEFINKGLNMYRTKHAHMEKFPEDIVRAETAVGGDVEILTRDEYQEVKKKAYAGIFGDTPKTKTPFSGKKGRGRGRTSESPDKSTPVRKYYKDKSDYKVHILVQSKEPTSQSAETASTPSTSRAGSETAEDKSQKVEPPTPTFSTPTISSTGTFSCPSCSFVTSRLNVLILHNKTHSVTYTPYTPSPVRKKLVEEPEPKLIPKTTKPPKTPRPRKEKTEKVPKKISQAQKRSAEEKADKASKKAKTDQEIKSSLLADWDDVDEEFNDDTSANVAGSPEVPVGAESPAVPTPAELPSAHVPGEMSSPIENKSEDSSLADKPECSSDSKYEFCEDEEWHVEADAGRKIPRVKNPKRKEETKSLSIDEDDVAKEVAEILNKTAVPELPSVPEPLKVEENFPEPSVVKSPDKQSDVSLEPSKSSDNVVLEKQPTKAIFKTKTFFRSRHSRSQDAIGKYVAEQLNAAERMDLSEGEMNGSENVSSPEARESPPVDSVKVARLAPKIQLKKMKAEAAQQREKEKSFMDPFGDEEFVPKTIHKYENLSKAKIASEDFKVTKSQHDVLYPTREIKPINKDSPDKKLHREDKKEVKILHETVNNTDKMEIDKDLNLIQENSTITKEAVSPQKISESSNKHQNEIIIQETSHEKSEQITSHHEIEITHHEEKVETTQNFTEINEQTSIDSSNDTIPINIPNNEILVGTANDTPLPSTSTELNESSPKKTDMHLQDPSSQVMENNEISPVTVQNKIIVYEQPSLETSPTKSFDTSQDKTEVKQVVETTQSAEVTPHISKYHEPSLQKSYEQMIQPYMNESTASAVDALLSVSRETDRVPRIIGNDPPEDLFEDDIKDSEMSEEHAARNDVVGNGMCEEEKMEVEETQTEQSPCGLNGMTDQEVLIHDINETVSLGDQSTTMREESAVKDNVEPESDPLKDQILPVPDVLSENIAIPQENIIDSVPSESDLQIAEALINLPAAAIQNKTSGEQGNNVEVPMCLDSEPFEEEIIPLTENVVEENKSFEAKENEAVIAETTSESLLISNNEGINIRYETELEKSENLNAAQSLVQMSESIADHKMNIENSLIGKKGPFTKKQNNGIDVNKSVEQKLALLSNENSCDTLQGKIAKFETTSSKLLKMLEEPYAPKPPLIKSSPIKQLIVPGKEKILNFDVAKSVPSLSPPLKAKSTAPKQKIIIRRSTSTPKRILNNLNEVVASADKIILTRGKKTAQDGSSVQTFTIQSPVETATQSDAKQIIIQQKIRKIPKPPTKLQKIKPQTSLVAQVGETKLLNDTSVTEESMFDISSMPVVLSDDLLTPESIEKMPIVMSDGNLMTNTSNPPKPVKAKPTIIENEKLPISKVPINPVQSKPEVKTLIMNAAGDLNKVTPNILSKSSKLRGAKPMLVIDKATGKQKIIMTKAEPAVKEIRQSPTLLQPVPQGTAKTEKFIILPTSNSPRAGRTQKIVIDPQTGKAHVLVSKGQEPPSSVPESKPVSAKLIPSTSDSNAPGNTVMIITNAQGAQSRIVLTPEHEKILFPNKQQPNVSQLKTITHRISTNTGLVQKTSTGMIQKSNAGILQKTIVTTASPVKTQTRIVPKQQKNAIITSRGQLIVGGRVATTAQNIAPMPEIRPAPKRIIASEPKKLVQAIQKNSSEPLIFLQQKSGAVMQLTAAQFEHMQRTGQIIQKSPATASAPVPAPSQAQENKVVIQKSISITPKDNPVPTVYKQRVRKTAAEPSASAKRFKQEIAIAPAPSVPLPALTAICGKPPAPAPTIVPAVSNTVSVATTPCYPELDNFEELLPSTAIARQAESTITRQSESAIAQHPEPALVQHSEPAVAQHPEPNVAPAATEPAEPAPLADGQLLAVPGENFGGPAGSFYLCVEDNGCLTPIDNRPLILENNQLVPMAVEPLPVFPPQPERRDILEAALANSDVFHADNTRDEAPDFRDLNANVSVHCRVSETSTTLNQPIMTPVEVPSKVICEPTTVPSNLEDGLAVIGVTPHTVPTSLELPITVTDPRIALKTTDPLSNANYRPLLPSPSTEMTFATHAEVPMGGPISMPLLTDEEAVGVELCMGGKSMPILTDEVAEQAASPASGGSPSPRADEGAWARRLLAPGSDESEASSEIPLQPALQLSVDDLSRNS